MLKSHSRAFNAVLGKVWHVASANVVVKLLKTKRFPILLYGLDACRLTKTQLSLLNYAISSSIRKMFNVTSNEIVYLCRSMFNCFSIVDMLCIRKRLEKVPIANVFWGHMCHMLYSAPVSYTHLTLPTIYSV